MEERINVNIRFIPEGSYVFEEVLGPAEETQKDIATGPVYGFPTDTSPARMLTVYGLPLVSLE